MSVTTASPTPNRRTRLSPATRRLLARCAFFFIVALAVSLLYRVVKAPWVAYRLAEDAHARGDHATAWPHYERALAGGVATRTLPLRAAQTLTELGRIPDALTLLAPHRRAQPPLPGMADLHAGLLDAVDRPAEALHVYFDALESGLAPTDAIRVRLADLFRRIARYRDAERIYQQVLANPGAPADLRVRASLHLAELLTWTQRPDEALAVLAALPEPPTREVRTARARALQAAGRPGEAAAEYRALLSE